MTKQTKIIFSVVLSCTMLLLLFIPAFASEAVSPYAEGDTMLIRAGVYKWNDGNLLDFPTLASVQDTYTFSLPFRSSITYDGIDYLVYSDALTIAGGTGNYLTILYYNVTGFSPDFPGVELPINYPIYLLDSSPQFPNGGQTFTVISDTYVPIDAGLWFESNTERISDYYEGNAFADIMTMVIEALDVPIFGAFSLWDMLTTVCGLFAVVWLLKLLAGG